MKEANVICNQLGYNGAQRVRTGYYGEGFGEIVALKNRGCDGGETNILDCDLQLTTTNNSYCYHSKDVGIECLGMYVFISYYCDRASILCNSNTQLLI